MTIAEKKRVYMREYYQKNKDRHKERYASWKRENPETYKEQKHIDYIKHREARLAQTKAWREVNVDKIKEQDHLRYMPKMQPIEGFFYILKFENYIKIGRAVNFDRRKKTYENHNPFKLEILHCVWVQDSNVKEKLARWEFRQYKHRGKDWFVDVPSEDIATNLGNWS